MAKKRKVVKWIPELSDSVSENIEMLEEQAAMVSNKARNKKEDIFKLIDKLRDSVKHKETVNYIFWKIVNIYIEYNYPRKSILEYVLLKFQPYYFYVYQLVRDNEVVYVGKSERVESRIQQHVLAGKKFDSVKVYLCSSEKEQDVLENTCIFKLWPEYNKSVNMSFADKNLEIPVFTDMREFKPDFTSTNAGCHRFQIGEFYYFVQCCGYINKALVKAPWWIKDKVSK